MTNPTLIHAAELLERDAQILAESMRDSEGEWDDTYAKDDHDDMLKTARELREMAEPVGTFACPICLNDKPHHHDKKRWIGVDFDGTLAFDPPDRKDPYTLGQPIPAMVNRVRDWICKGYTVKILTARMNKFSHTSPKPRNLEYMRMVLRDWTEIHIGRALEATCEKDGMMEVLWDDRAVRVVRDTGNPDLPREMAEKEGMK